jgi:hypothetical protein
MYVCMHMYVCKYKNSFKILILNQKNICTYVHACFLQAAVYKMELLALAAWRSRHRNRLRNRRPGF